MKPITILLLIIFLSTALYACGENDNSSSVDGTATNTSIFDPSTPILQPNNAVTRRPIVTFTCDGGSIGDYEKIRPLSIKYGFKVTSAITTDFIDKHLAGKMTWDQIRELQSLGWEIASHSKTHPHLSTLSDSEITLELQGSRDILVAQGLNCRNLVYPYGDSNTNVRNIVPKYYRCAVKVGEYLKTDGRWSTINAGDIDPLNLARVSLGAYFDYHRVGLPSTNTFEYYKYRIDEAVAQNGWLIFMMHPSDVAHDATQQAILEQIIQYIQSINVNILTLDQGYDLFSKKL